VDGSGAAQGSGVDSVLPLRLKILSAEPPALTIGETVSLEIERGGREGAVIRVKGARLSVQAPHDLEPGRVVTARVIHAGPNPVLEIRAGDIAGKMTTTLQPGIYTGRIVGGSGGVFQLETESGLWEIASSKSLEIGRELVFRVEESGRGLRAVILQGSTEAEEAARALLEKHLPMIRQPDKVPVRLRTALAGLRADHPAADRLPVLEKLEGFFREAEMSPPDAKQIFRWIRDGGLQYESKLGALAQGAQPGIENDLKQMLLQLADAPPGSFPAQFAQLQDAADQYLRWLEVQQAANVLNSLSGDPFRLAIPLTVGAETVMAQLSFQEDSREDSGGNGEERKGTSILFLLELNGLGKTRIDAFLSSSRLTATIFVENQEALTEMRSRLGSLYEELEADGFNFLKLEVRALKEVGGNEQPEPDPLGIESVRDRIRLLNIKA